MLDKACPQCGRSIGVGRFMSAVTGGKARLVCPDCGRVLKRDLSLFVGLFYIGFTMLFFPVLMVFGLSKTPGSSSTDRIQKIFDVGPGAAFAIGMGTLLGFVVLYLLVFSFAFTRIEFDRDD